MPRSNWTSRIILTTDAPRARTTLRPGPGTSAKESDTVTPRRRQLPSSPAFTTIELLIAMSIVVLLAGMVFVGFKAVGRGGNTRATGTTLETAKSLLNEVEISKGMPQVKAVYALLLSATKYDYAFPPLPSTTVVPTPVPAPGGNISADVGGTLRFKADAIVRTQLVMQRLQTITANRATITNLPSRSLLAYGLTTAPAGTPGVDVITTAQVGGKYQPSPPMLVDAWGNPLIYVPPAGLSGVTFTDNAGVQRVVTSARVRSAYTLGVTSPTADNYQGFEPGASGFWASAGPDGDFTKGDDNLYSFEGF